MAKLELQNVSFAYDRTEVLKNISANFSEKGLTLVLGPNGSGKSTLLRVIAGLLDPSQGAIQVDGAPLHPMVPAERARKLAWLGQQGATDFAWTAFDFALMGRFPHHRSYEKADADDLELVQGVLKKLEIEALANRAMKTLSGGERQLVRIARALAQDTPILLLDEPFASLDLRHRASLWNILTSENKITIAVTHDVSMIGPNSRELVLLHEGTIAARGSAQEILQHENFERVYGWSPPPGWVFTPFPFAKRS